MDAGPERVARYQRQQRKIKLALFLTSLACSTVALITFDYLYSAAMQRANALNLRCDCVARDPVRNHAFMPSCTCIANWGKDSYELFTNNLGFRDEQVREVPLADARPRILVLGNSFTEGKTAWHNSYVGRVAAHFPQYDFLDGGLSGYSPSNYLNTARMVLAKGVEIDEVILFIGVNEVRDEAAMYQDIDASGAVTLTKPEASYSRLPWSVRKHLPTRLPLTYSIFGFLEQFLVRHGYYHVTVTHPELPVFDLEASAWTYRKVNETHTWPSGYAPLGVEGGIAKMKAKMTLLWQELEKRNIPISVVVYPDPAQLLHETTDSRQVRIWRDWCEGKCKRFISLFPAFFAAKNRCPWDQPGCWYLNLFIFGDIHYNAAGNALVADAVMKSLEEYPPSKVQRQVSGPHNQPAVQLRRPTSGGVLTARELGSELGRHQAKFFLRSRP
jgi:hypothetical protein